VLDDNFSDMYIICIFSLLEFVMPRLRIIYAIFLKSSEIFIYMKAKKDEIRLSEVKGLSSLAQEFFLGRFLPVTVGYGFNIVLTLRPVAHYLIFQLFAALNALNLTINAQPIRHKAKTIIKIQGAQVLQFFSICHILFAEQKFWNI